MGSRTDGSQCTRFSPGCVVQGRPVWSIRCGSKSWIYSCGGLVGYPPVCRGFPPTVVADLWKEPLPPRTRTFDPGRRRGQQRVSSPPFQNATASEPCRRVRSEGYRLPFSQRRLQMESRGTSTFRPDQLPLGRRSLTESEVVVTADPHDGNG